MLLRLTVVQTPSADKEERELEKDLQAETVVTRGRWDARARGSDRSTGMIRSARSRPIHLVSFRRSQASEPEQARIPPLHTQHQRILTEM